MWSLLLAAGMLVKVPTSPEDCTRLQDRYGCVPFALPIFEACYPQVRCFSLHYEETPLRVVRVRVDTFGGSPEEAAKTAKAACSGLPPPPVGSKFQCHVGNHTPEAGKRLRVKLVIERD